MKSSVSLSAVPDSWPPHGLQPTRLLCPWEFPGKVYSFYSIQWLSEPGTVVDHGGTFHCPAPPDSPEKHLTGAQSSERRGIPLQVTRASPYCMVSAAPQVRGERCGVGGEAVHPSGNSFLVGRRRSGTPLWPSHWLQMKRLIAVTSWEARKSPKQGEVKNPLLIVCSPSE